MTNRQIVDLPLNGRGFSDLARLTPGVVSLPGTGNVTRIRPEAVNGTTISGVRGRQVSFYLDGADTSEQHQGGSWIQTSIDALQEFSVQQNAYSAEHSRSGSFFNATTKSGTNRVHGTAIRVPAKRKTGFPQLLRYANERHLKRNQFGASVGGPVVLPKIYNGSNRTFFFFNYEGMRERQGNVITRTSPTAAMLQGDFSAVSNMIYDPLTTTTAPSGSRYDSDSVSGQSDPCRSALAASAFFNPFTTAATHAGGLYIFSPSTAVDMDQITTRFDHTINDAPPSLLPLEPEQQPAQRTGRFARARHRRFEDARSELHRSASPAICVRTLMNEFRFNTLYGLINLNPYLLGRDFNKEAGIAGLEETRRSLRYRLVPGLCAGRAITSLTGSAFDQRPKTQDRYTREFADNITWIKGKHVFKFGTKIRYYSWLGTDSKDYMGSGHFNGQNTENPASPARHRRLVCGLGARVAFERRTRLSFGHVRRRLHRLALLLCRTISR